MGFHIVTNRCFLACDKVNSIVIEELITERQLPPRRKAKRRKSKKTGTQLKKKPVPPIEEEPRQFVITIGYYPSSLQGQQNNRGDPSEYSLDLRVNGKKEAYALYGEIVKEVQEQHPGEGYLDTLVSKMLAGTDFTTNQPEREKDDDNDDW